MATRLAPAPRRPNDDITPHIDTINLFAKFIHENRGPNQIIHTTVAARTFESPEQAHHTLKDALGVASYTRVAKALNGDDTAELMHAEAALKLERHFTDDWRTLRKLTKMHQILSLIQTTATNEQPSKIEDAIKQAFKSGLFKTRSEFDQTLDEYIRRSDNFDNKNHVSEFADFVDTSIALLNSRQTARQATQQFTLQAVKNWWHRFIKSQRGQELRAQDIINTINQVRQSISSETNRYNSDKTAAIIPPQTGVQAGTETMPQRTLQAIIAQLLKGGDYLSILESFAWSTGHNLKWAEGVLKTVLPNPGYHGANDDNTRAALILHRFPQTARQTMAQLHVHRILNASNMDDIEKAFTDAFNAKFGTYDLFARKDFDSLKAALRKYQVNEKDKRASELIKQLETQWETLGFQERYFFGVELERLIRMAVQASLSARLQGNTPGGER